MFYQFPILVYTDSLLIFNIPNNTVSLCTDLRIMTQEWNCWVKILRLKRNVGLQFIAKSRLCTSTKKL